MTRDPRQEPRAGDVLSIGGKAILVLTAEGGSVHYACDGDRGERKLVEWRWLVKAAEVVHVAGAS